MAALFDFFAVQQGGKAHKVDAVFAFDSYMARVNQQLPVLSREVILFVQDVVGLTCGAVLSLGQELSKILLQDIKDPRIKFVTVTGVELTDDISLASSFSAGLLSYSPFTSDRISSVSAPTISAVIADRMSLSPKLSS